jgi:hypothetical protein
VVSVADTCTQVTPELSMSMRIRPICKSLHIHTYIHCHSPVAIPSLYADGAQLKEY